MPRRGREWRDDAETCGLHLAGAAVAPGYRDWLSSLSRFAVQDSGTAARSRPREGAGVRLAAVAAAMLAALIAASALI
jgi:hypothetical protein